MISTVTQDSIELTAPNGDKVRVYRCVVSARPVTDVITVEPNGQFNRVYVTETPEQIVEKLKPCWEAQHTSK